MRRSIMALEGLDDTALDTSNVEGAVHDPDRIVQNNIIDLDVSNGEVQELDTAIEDGENAQSALTDLAEALLPAVTGENPQGLEPHEVAAIDVAVEHFKKKINYQGSKRLPALENFGGKMPKAQATKLALEELSSLVAEIDQQLQKAYVMQYEYVTTSIDQVEKARSSLLSLANEVSVKTQEFYKSEKYKPEFSGSELLSGTYTTHVFNSKEAIDGKMPGAAVVSALNAFKASLSTAYYLSKVQELKNIVSSLVNSTELNKDVVKSHFEQGRILFENLVSAKSYVSDYRQVKSIDYPLSGIKLEISSNTEQQVIKNNYWYGDTSVTKELVDETKAKLGALSSEESVSTLAIVTELNQSGEFTKELAEVIEQAILLLKKVDDSEKAIRVKDSKAADEFSEEQYKFRNIIGDTLHFFNTVARNELKVLSAIVDYNKDSVAFLSTRELAV